MATAQEKKAIRDWEEYRKSLIAGTALEHNKSKAEIDKHRQYLEARPLEWMRYFFPTYATSDFAPFQVRYINRIILHPEWWEVNSWSRELAKDTVTMMLMIFLNLTAKKKFTLFVSSSWDAACDLLMPYMINYESNSRISAYYGEQKTFGKWERGDFTAKCGARYVALGVGQSPRGKKNEQLRPDSIIVTDVDTDEDVRNRDTVDKHYDWIERALYMTRSISKPLLFLLLGNVIARYCCVTRAAERADHHDIINIRDKEGKSTWPQKNTEEMIDRVLSKMSTKAQQAECFNNPLSEGDIFKEIIYKKCPPLAKMPYVIAYADPAPSNKDKQKKGVSYKSLWLIGYRDGIFYVYKGFLDQVNNSTFVDWFYSLRDYVAGRTQVFYFIENNTLQDPFFQQVFKPMFYASGKEKGFINITPDDRRKPEKGIRIPGTLEPLNRDGQLVFNIDEKDDPNMKRLDEQFRLFTEQLRAPADGPDSIEGGVFKLNEKIAAITSGEMKTFTRQKNNKRI